MTENLSIEEQLRTLIESKYKSLRAFAIEAGLAHSSILNVFKRGIMNSGLVTITKIFNTLDLEMDSIATGTLKTKPPPGLSQGGIKEDINCLLDSLSDEELIELKGYIKRMISENKSDEGSDKQIRGTA